MTGDSDKLTKRQLWRKQKKQLKKQGKYKPRPEGSQKRKDEPEDKKRLRDGQDDGDPFPGAPPIDPKKVKKYKRSDIVDPSEATKHKKSRAKMHKERIKTRQTVVDAIRSELLLTEESGYLEPDEYEATYQITQKEIQEAVDITAATKHFDLKLDYGPYRMDYSRNGRNLVIGGRRGHVAAFDWVTRSLQCEFNVQESVHDVQYLHMPQMFAVAQKDYTHIYDNKGTELHCLKALFRVTHLDFLPYHFLLVAGSDTGFLHYLDVSTGTTVASFRMPHCGGKFTCLTQNKTNAIIHTGHPNGTVALWSPNEREPLMKTLAHASAVQSIAIDESGSYIATCAADRSLKIYDLRNHFKHMFNYKLRTPPHGLCFSQKNLLAAALGPVVEVYRDPTISEITTPYLRHKVAENIVDASFCNFEDVMGLGHGAGFSSILVPGAGEANFDAFESNPFMTNSQRKEMEVKMLLEKIQPELISLDASELARVDKDGLQAKLSDKDKLRHVKKREIEFESRRRHNQKTAQKHRVKVGLKEDARREEIKSAIRDKNKFKPPQVDRPYNPLDRFKSK